IEVSGNCKLIDLSRFCLSYSLTGLEWSAGIPGTVGGAIRGNAGAFGSKMEDVVKKVKILEIFQENKKAVRVCSVKKISSKKCKFEYRGSIFKKKKLSIILSAELALKKCNKKDIKEKISSYLKSRAGKHPINYPNAGSIFKNVSYENKLNVKKLTDIPEIFLERKIIPAGWFIEQRGLKGKRIGDAMISKKHANFIVNLGDAKAKDVTDLIKLVKKEVKKKFKVELEEELVVVD
ncbi:UDP-N-acetylmuramate dehydrogenase, partial [Patescibacteria group bacterium]